VSVYEANEEIALLYSSPEDPKHPQTMCKNDVQETAQDSVEEHSRTSDDQLCNDYSAKGYNTIFYRTVQYLRMVFRRKHNVDDVEKIKTHADRGESEERNENHKVTHLMQGIDQNIRDKRKAMYALGIHNVTLSFKQGEFIAIVGKEGAGKTTLLKILSGRLMCRCNRVSSHCTQTKDKVAVFQIITLHVSKITLFGYNLSKLTSFYLVP